MKIFYDNLVHVSRKVLFLIVKIIFQYMNNQLNTARKLVIENINKCKGLIESWDGEPTNVTPEEHYEHIVEWAKTHIKNKAWSSSSTQSWRNGATSYGAKHECERDLKCYVANNWMKMAMIDAGLDVTYRTSVDYETGKVYREKIFLSDVLKNSVNFIFRVSRNNDMIAKWIINETKLKYKED